MAPGQRNCQAEAETPVTSLLAAHIWKHKGTSDAFISSMWLPPGDQEGGKHNDKQSQDTQAHCNGSYFAVSIRKAFFFFSKLVTHDVKRLQLHMNKEDLEVPLQGEGLPAGTLKGIPQLCCEQLLI